MDRHARATRVRADVRRRPADGFRLADRDRFAQVALMAVLSLPGAVGRAAAAAELVVADVPEPGQPTALAVLELRPGGHHRLTVYRRPLELRADSKADLADLLREAVHAEVSGTLGLDDGA